MRPAWFRNRWGFGIPAFLLSASLATPAFSQTLKSSLLTGAAPLAIAAGAVTFGAIATIVAVNYRRVAQAAEADATAQLAGMRAGLDEYEGLLSALPEVTILFNDAAAHPRVFGTLPDLPAGAGNLLSFESWLAVTDARALSLALQELRVTGRPFNLGLSTRGGRAVRALGRAAGSGAVLRLHMPAQAAAPIETDLPAEPTEGRPQADRKAARAILSLMQKPAWIRDRKGKLVYTNAAYRSLALNMGKGDSVNADPVEIFSTGEAGRHTEALKGGRRAVRIEDPLPDYPEYELILFTLSDGTAGYLGTSSEPAARTPRDDQNHISGVVDALATPVAVFDADMRLQQFNRAYQQFWDFEAGWLQTGLTEKAILDRLRARGQLPAVPDFPKWREAHLKTYQISEPVEDNWYLPDGRSVKFVAAPASSEGGVIYVFEDVTQTLRLESANKAMADVQRESLNALNEAVAVFSTDGRLKLSNPRLSEIWKLPVNELETGPHIDRIAASCAAQWAEDGASIWQQLKEIVIDLSANRADRSGRISRSDKRLIDYAAVRLPDGQTMLTFADVTESASYQRVLKERNDALVTADRLKDAFVQNVSYELRSPLTNIIGFSDLLASGSVGPLNDKQRQYTDYIRASSATLGLLIDNILDLTHVDAGIAELELGEQDVPNLIERARAGLGAVFSGTADKPPIELVIEVPNDLPPFVADGKRVVQILYNLLSNAAKFCEPGSNVVLRVEARGGWFRFIVEDEGMGVPEDLRAAMFQRFEGRAVEGRQRGAGLGLAIVKSFAELHGGTVTLEEHEPRGTRVIVTLPADASAIRPAGAVNG